MAVGTEIIEHRFHFGGILIAGQGLNDALVFVQKNGCRITEPVVEPFCGKFVVAACSVLFELVCFVLVHDVLLLFGVEFHRVVVVVPL